MAHCANSSSQQVANSHSQQVANSHSQQGISSVLEAEGNVDDRTEIPPPQIRQYVEVANLEISERSTGGNPVLQLGVLNLPRRIEKNAEGHTILHLAAARDSATVRRILDHRPTIEVIAMLNDKTEREGWTSLHVSTIAGNEKIVAYILDKISNNEQKQKFIEQTDNLGLTSPQWGSLLDHRDSVEMLMDNLSLEDQVKLMTNKWSLLHATAYGNAVSTMSALMNRFEDGKTKWNIMKCPNVDGKTALHIAVAQGNAKAVIMLLDIAGENRAKLLAIPDNANKTVQSYNKTQFPFLEQYIEISIKFDSPVLHQAAADKDRILVSWILDTHPDPYVIQLNKKNTEGWTVIQTASYGGRDEVIEEISRVVPQEDFVNCLLVPSDEGKTALHLAATSNNPSTVHIILKRVLHSQKLKEVIGARDKHGETPLQIAQKLKHQLIENVFHYYEMISSENFSKLFSGIEHSFYTLNIPAIEVEYRNGITQSPEEGDQGTFRDVNYDATTCMMLSNPDRNKCKYLVGIAQKIDRDNINTWCNKGMLMTLEQSSATEIEDVAFKLLDLIVEPSGIPQLRARIDFAYRLAESYRTADAKTDSYEIFKFGQRESSLHSDSEMREYCAYHFLKVLVRDLRSDDRHKKPDEWFQQRMQDAIDQLLTLIKSTSDDYKSHAWLWLAELQLAGIPKHITQEAIAVFDRESQTECNSELESCLNMALMQHQKNNCDRKFKPRLAKNCLYYSYKCEKIHEKQNWLEHALRQSKEWMADNGMQIMCANTSAQALICLWAMSYYSAYTRHVEESYQQYWGRKGRTERDYWEYLQSAYYTPALTGSKCNLDYLIRARHYLEYLIPRLTHGADSCGIKYARVCSLLRAPHRNIVQILERAADSSTRGIRRATALENLGQFYLAEKHHGLAKVFFEQAFKECDPELHWKLRMAKNGRAILDRMNQAPYYRHRSRRGF